MVFLPDFSVVDKNWLVYQPVLSVVDKNSWYINRFCRSWTILGGIFHGCVLLGQYWLVNQPVLSFMDSNGWLSPCFVCRGQYWLVYLPMFYVMNKNGWYITRFWYVMVYHHIQHREIYQPIFSTTDKTWRLTNHYCP